MARILICIPLLRFTWPPLSLVEAKRRGMDWRELVGLATFCVVKASVEEKENEKEKDGKERRRNEGWKYHSRTRRTKLPICQELASLSLVFSHLNILLIFRLFFSAIALLFILHWHQLQAGHSYAPILADYSFTLWAYITLIYSQLKSFIKIKLVEIFLLWIFHTYFYSPFSQANHPLCLQQKRS